MLIIVSEMLIIYKTTNKTECRVIDEINNKWITNSSK